MADAAGAPVPPPHKFKFPSSLLLPKAATLTGNAALQQDILADLQFRIHEVEDLHKEIERLRLLNGRVNVPNLNAMVEPAAAAPPAAAPAADDKDTRIADLERRLAASVETTRLQKEAWDAEKAVFAVARAAPDPGSAVVADAAVDVRDQRIIDQQLRIDTLTDDVIHWRELYDNRASSTTSNTLDGLLRKLKRVVRLHFDDLDDVYHAVAEAICAHTTPAQRHDIRGAPMNKE